VSRKKNKASVTLPEDFDFSKICGVDVFTAVLCRCGCPLVRVCPHSTKSQIPIWKCVWCRERLGHVTEAQAKLLEKFVCKFGWPVNPVIFHEDGNVYAFGDPLRTSTHAAYG
jgi:hypothetical protein